MFIVCCTSPLDDLWEERDVIIHKTAGRKSCTSAAGYNGENKERVREHKWLVDNFKEAIKLKDKLNRIDQVTATFREHNSYAAP